MWFARKKIYFVMLNNFLFGAFDEKKRAEEQESEKKKGKEIARQFTISL